MSASGPGFVEPLNELLHAAAKFGGDFDRDGDQQHLTETLANIQTLKQRALSCVRGVGVLVEACALHGDGVESDAGTAVWFLTELVMELDSMEGKVTAALKRVG